MNRNPILVRGARRVAALVAFGVAYVALGATAWAYPQYTLSRGQSCAECHTSPAGGGLLTEQGMVTAEDKSSFGHAPEFFYGKLKTPDWLALGGDFRALAGAKVIHKEAGPLIVPMQTDVYARASSGAFALYLQGGLKLGERGPQSFLQSREHYVQWQQKPGEATSWFVRAGKFMPTIGLRLAEHTMYTRRYGGSPLFGEAYGVSVSKIAEGYELHATGFVRDWRLPIDPYSGGALHLEKRLGKGAVGGYGRFGTAATDNKTHAGVVAKYYLEGPDVLFSADAQFIRHNVFSGPVSQQVAAMAMASWFVKPSLLLDGAVSFYNPNLQRDDLHREAADVQLHWFATSHLELLASMRVQAIAWGSGGPGLLWANLQLHYRL